MKNDLHVPLIFTLLLNHSTQTVEKSAGFFVLCVYGFPSHPCSEPLLLSFMLTLPPVGLEVGFSDAQIILLVETSLHVLSVRKAHNKVARSDLRLTSPTRATTVITAAWER